MGKDGVRYREDLKVHEARLLVPREMRATLGKTYLYFYHKQKSEAKRKRQAGLAKLLQDGPRAFNAERITFGEWLERWLSGPLKSSVSEGTYGFYEGRARRYLIPTLGGVRLQDLTAEHLDGLYSDVARGKPPATKPLSPTTIGQIHATARVALGRAAKKGVIRSNPAQYAEPPRVRKKERPTIGVDELEKFFAAAAGERLEALWIVWVLTGLRPGEVLALKWSDVRDAEGGAELLIRRSYSATGSGAYMRETTKTGKGRPVTLLPAAAAALKTHRTRYLEEQVKLRPVWERNWKEHPEFRDLVFPSVSGTAIDHNNLNRQHFKPLLKRAGLPDMRPYDLRHTFATLWIESGESADVLQKVLGHSSITLTLDTYAHLSPRYQRESFGRFGASFQNKSW